MSQHLRHQQTSDGDAAADDLAYVPPPQAATAPVAAAGRPASAAQERAAAVVAAPAAAAGRPASAGQGRAAAAAAPPVVYEAAPAQPAQPARPARVPVVVSVPGVSWGRQVILEGALYVLAWAFWTLNALFTILGLQALFLPTNGLGVILGLLIHVGISWGERYFTFQRSWTALLGLGMAVVDIGTNISGLVAGLRLLRPAWVAGVPENPLIWLQAIGERIWHAITEQPVSPMPDWGMAAIWIIVGAVLVALCPEYLISYFRRRLGIVLQRRPA